MADGRPGFSAMRGRSTRLVRVAIWLATAVFIGMLFAPLVQEMRERIGAQSETVGPP